MKNRIVSGYGQETIEDEMEECGITQKQLTEILGVSPSCTSEYMTAKAEPILKVSWLFHQKLDIDPDFIPG